MAPASLHRRLLAVIFVLLNVVRGAAGAEICPSITHAVRFAVALPTTPADFSAVDESNSSKHEEFRTAVYNQAPVHYGVIPSDVSLWVESLDRYLNLSLRVGYPYTTLNPYVGYDTLGKCSISSEQSCKALLHAASLNLTQVLAETVRVDGFVLAESSAAAMAISSSFSPQMIETELNASLAESGISLAHVLEPPVIIIKKLSSRMPGRRDFMCPCSDSVYARSAATDVLDPQCSCVAPPHCDVAPELENASSTTTTDGDELLCVCNRGETGPNGGPCSPCASGMFKGSVGSGACTLCTEGTYSSSKGGISSKVCNLCPANSLSPEGSKVVVDCFCNSGYTGPNGVDCPACVPGKYKVATGSAPCDLCGYYTRKDAY